MTWKLKHHKRMVSNPQSCFFLLKLPHGFQLWNTVNKGLTKHWLVSGYLQSNLVTTGNTYRQVPIICINPCCQFMTAVFHRFTLKLFRNMFGHRKASTSIYFKKCPRDLWFCYRPNNTFVTSSYSVVFHIQETHI